MTEDQLQAVALFAAYLKANYSPDVSAVRAEPGTYVELDHDELDEAVRAFTEAA